MKAFLYALVVFYASAGFAVETDTYKVEKANSDHSRLILSGDVKAIQIGSVLQHSDEFGEVCQGEVVKVSEKTLVADISMCKNPQKVKVGESMSLIERQAAEDVAPTTEKSSSSMGGLPSRNESWYTLWGLGFSGVSYEDKTQNLVDQLESSPGVDRATVNMDMFGFYWPTSDYKSMFGVVVNAVSDSFEGPGGTLTMLQYTLGFSYHTFFGQNIGDGWFLRGDIGPSWYSVNVDTTALKDEERSDVGVGILGGGGYSFVVGEETRLPLGFYFTHRSADGESVVSANLTLSLLF